MTTTPFTLLAVIQDGRLTYEAVLLLASLRRSDPGFAGRVVLAHPVAGADWSQDPAPQNAAARDLLTSMGAELVPFESQSFGAWYPYGNKIEALSVLPANQPFLFLDTDTLITGQLSDVDFDFDRPSASMRREGTWPQIETYGPGYAGIWKSLYDRFGLEFETSLDLSQPDEYWKRYLYFNAGWFFGADPQIFGQRFRDWALSIRHDTPDSLASQSLDPWLDQVTLPLVIHSLGGGRPGPGLDGLDGEVTCHYRSLPLLYARESDAALAVLEAVAAPNPIKRVLKEYEPIKHLVYHGRGARIRQMFDRNNLPRKEQMIRNQIKKAGLWVR